MGDSLARELSPMDGIEGHKSYCSGMQLAVHRDSSLISPNSSQYRHSRAPFSPMSGCASHCQKGALGSPLPLPFWHATTSRAAYMPIPHPQWTLQSMLPWRPRLALAQRSLSSMQPSLKIPILVRSEVQARLTKFL